MAILTVSRSGIML